MTGLCIQKKETDMNRLLCLGMTLVVFCGCCSKSGNSQRRLFSHFSKKQVERPSGCGCAYCKQGAQSGVQHFAEASADCGCDEIVGTIGLPTNQYVAPLPPPFQPEVEQAKALPVAKLPEPVSPPVEVVAPKTDDSQFLDSLKLEKAKDVIEDNFDNAPIIPLHAIPPITKDDLGEAAPEPVKEIEEPTRVAQVFDDSSREIVLKARPVQSHTVNDARQKAAELANKQLDRFGLPVKGRVEFKELPEMDPVAESDAHSIYYNMIKTPKSHNPKAILPSTTLDRVPPRPWINEANTSGIKHHSMVEVPITPAKLKPIQKPIEVLRMTARPTNDPDAGKAVANIRMRPVVIKKGGKVDLDDSVWQKANMASQDLHSHVPMLKASAKLITVER